MRVYISGVAGFLGSHLADHFIAQGHDVRGNDNLMLGDKANIPNILWSTMDCRDFASHPEMLKDIDVLYHCAATAHEGLSVFSPSFITKNIYEASVAVFSAAIQAGVKRIVFCTSMARYGRGKGWTAEFSSNGSIKSGLHEKEPPFTEEFHIPAPCDPYGISKVAAEDTLKALCNAHGVEYVIAVPHNIIGLRQNYTDPFRNVASIMINRMKQGKQPIIYGDGTQVRCFSPVVDVIDTLAKLAIEPGISGGVFNIGPDDGEMTINELAETIADILGFDLRPVYMPGRPLEVKHATCSSENIRNRFGYKRIQSVRDCLTEMCAAIEPKPFNYNLPLEIITDKTPATWKDRLM